MNLQWYPGHMTKAKRAMQDDIKLVDLVIELLDARVPLSSENPDIEKLAAGKFRLVLLNKADLSDETANAAWIRHFAAQNITCIALDSRATGNMKKVKNAITDVCREKIERDKKRGILNRPIRAMVAGIPNVGKSTFINSFAGKSAAKTGNKPGVTKGNQWIRLDKNTELLDTPGILWPKFEDETVGIHLAFIGSINDDVVDKTELCYEFVRHILSTKSRCLAERYEVEINSSEAETPSPDYVNGLIEEIAYKRNCLKKGGEADIFKVSGLIIDDFRTGKLGKITVEMPDNE